MAGEITAIASSFATMAVILRFDSEIPIQRERIGLRCELPCVHTGRKALCQKR